MGRQAAKAKRAAKKAAMQEAEVKDDDLVDELWKVGGKIGKFSGSVSRDDDLVDELWPAGSRGEKWFGKKGRDDDLVDDLGSAKGKIGKFSGGIKWADNSLTCDSEGNSCSRTSSSSRRSRLLLARLPKGSPELLAKLLTKLSLSVAEMMMTNETAS